MHRARWTPSSRLSTRSWRLWSTRWCPTTTSWPSLVRAPWSRSAAAAKREIKVTRIHFYGVPNNDPVVLLSPMDNPSYSCGREECRKKAWLEKRGRLDTWATVVGATVAKLSDFRCDFCFLLGTCNEIHPPVPVQDQELLQRRLQERRRLCPRGLLRARAG